MEKMVKRAHRSNDELESLFVKIMKGAMNKSNRYISNSEFDDVAAQLYSVKGEAFNLSSSINKRFGEGTEENGMNVLRRKFNMASQNFKPKSREFVLDILYQLYIKKGKKQPLYDDVHGSGISHNTINKHFGRFSNAINEMFDYYNLKSYEPPVTNRRKGGDPVGHNIEKYGLGIKEATRSEQMVVIVFAKVHHLLGFPTIEKIQEPMPDCRAKCTRKRFGDKLGRYVNIEFKYDAVNAFKGGRKIEDYVSKEVLYLICWKNTSSTRTIESLSNNGVEIIELEKELEALFLNGKLPKEKP